MDFRFSPEEEALRREAMEFVRREWRDNGTDAYSLIVASYDVDDPHEQERMHDFAKKLANKGWWTMHWPKQFGGWGAPLSTQLAYREAMAYAGAPESVGGGMFAPMLMLHGAQWQKDFFLPRIASGEIVHLSQGFSEPNAGSDLANVQTRAVEDGDDYVLNGQKIWNSEGRWSDWGHYLVRTDPTAPKHRGISYFLVDMKAPGVAMRPLYDGLGRWRWSEVFLEDVRVPKRNLIGELNRGFYTAMTTLSFERSQIEVPARLIRFLEQFIAEQRQRKRAGHGPSVLDDPIARNRLADLRVQIESTRMLSYRVAWLQSQGQVPDKEASMVKVTGDETAFAVYNTLARLAREEAVYLPRSTPRAPMGGFLGANAWLIRGLAVGGGTDEVQRNIIAQRGLGLPR
jgi:alkylation response protein AidB-like acyl-CoA dehydrogenase